MKNIDMSLDDYLDTDKHLELGTLNRYHYNLLMECRDMYNFSLTVEATDSWGYVQSDGSIDGLVDLLNRSVVDFGASPIFYRTERARVVDYSVGTWIMRSAFLFRKPVPKEPPIQIFVRPFSTCVWYSIAFVLLTIVVIYKAILVHETVDDGNDSNWMHSVTLCLGVICQQGSHHVPQSSSGKIFLWSILLFSTILLQFYSGYILTYILMDTPPVIRNLKDLLNSSMRMGCEDVLYFRDYFRLATDPISKAIYTEKIKNESGFYKPAEGMRLVADGGFAFYVQTSAAYPIIGDDFDAESVCDLDEIEMFRTQLMYANVQKKSPFKQLFDHCFRRLYENGNIKHMRFHWDKMAPICIKRSDRIKPVGIQEFACAPIVLACGFMVSLCALAAEILVKRFKNSTRNNNEKVRKKRNAAKGSLVGWNMRKNRAKKRLF